MPTQMKNLSKKKTKWVKQFKPQAVKGTPIRNNVAIEQRYHAAIDKIVQRMAKETEREIIKLYKSPHGKEYFAQDASVASQARILMNKLQDKFDKMFGDTANVQAGKMVNAANRESKAAVGSSMQQLAGMTINSNVTSINMQETMKASIAANVDLIKSIPQEYFKRISGAVYRSITSGTGLGDLVPQMTKYKMITERRAKTIALDQTRKAYQSITRDRLNKLGVKKFEWVHSGGGLHPRSYHLNVLNGNTYSYDDPPVIDPETGVRGFPGDLPNCKCVLRPILEFDDGNA